MRLNGKVSIFSVAQIESKVLRFNGANQTEKGDTKPPKWLAQIEPVYPTFRQGFINQSPKMHTVRLTHKNRFHNI